MRRPDRRGSNAIEFAICMPLFLFLVSAAVDFGWFFFHKAMLDHAVYAGCRSGSLADPGKDDISLASVISRAEADTRADLVSNTVLCPAGAACDISAYVTGESPTRSLVCNVTYQWKPLFGLSLPALSTTSRQVARMEWQRQ